MIRDLDSYSASQFPSYDVIIIGSGPAGTTLVNELASQGLAIAVLESGLERASARGDRLRQVRSTGFLIKEYSRERVLGGASTTWAGLSAPLDEVDFESRSCLRQVGWPLQREQLLPYYAQAAARYRFPALEYFDGQALAALRAKGELQPRWRELEEKVFLAAAEPQNFGREWQAVYRGPAADLWLDATVLELLCAPDGRSVVGLRARTRSGKEWSLSAKRYVLATGGIENARLLLCSKGTGGAALGNAHDQVGRYFMNHPKNYHGIVHLSQPLSDWPYFLGCLYQGFAGYAGLRLALPLQRARGLLNSYVRFEPLFPWSDNPGVESLVALVKRSKGLLRRFTRRQSEDVIALRDYSETGDDSELQNARKGAAGWMALALRVLLHLPSVSLYLYYRLTRAKPKIRRLRVRNFMEMEPDPENRVQLAAELDPDGKPLPLVRYRVTELDRRSLIALHESLQKELEQNGVGRLETDLAAASPWPIDQDASHHIGTTRMGDDPETSVVDRNCRVHGLTNLYVAGASVFPTSGCANPTFTIVALAIRLAEHLASQTKESPQA